MSATAEKREISFFFKLVIQEISLVATPIFVAALNSGDSDSALFLGLIIGTLSGVITEAMTQPKKSWLWKSVRVGLLGVTGSLTAYLYANAQLPAHPAYAEIKMHFLSLLCDMQIPAGILLFLLNILDKSETGE